MKDGVASGAHAVITACLARIESILEPTLLYVVTVRVSCTRVVQDSDRQAFEPLLDKSSKKTQLDLQFRSFHT